MNSQEPERQEYPSFFMSPEAKAREIEFIVKLAAPAADIILDPTSTIKVGRDFDGVFDPALPDEFPDVTVIFTDLIMTGYRELGGGDERYVDAQHFAFPGGVFLTHDASQIIRAANRDFEFISNSTFDRPEWIILMLVSGAYKHAFAAGFNERYAGTRRTEVPCPEVHQQIVDAYIAAIAEFHTRDLDKVKTAFKEKMPKEQGLIGGAEPHDPLRGRNEEGQIERG